MSEVNFDRASEVEMLMLEQALEAQKRKAVYLKPNGHCKWCREPVAEGLNFCDEDCRDDYDADMKRKQRG